jgi:lipooligosaccharide transport system permease protein
MSILANISWKSIQVWRRNRDVFFTTWKTNFIPPFLEPILYLTAMGLGFGILIGQVEYQGNLYDYAKFLAPGLIAISIMYSAFFECTYGSFIRMHYQKTFDAIIATPLSIEDVIVGEMLWGATKALLNSTIVLGVVVVAGLADFPGFFLVPIVAFMGGLMFAAIAMVFTALVPNIDSFNYPFFLLITPMFLFSGTFFPLTVLPEWGQSIAQGLPLTHVTTMIRDFSFDTYQAMDLVGLIYIAALTAITFLVAVKMMKKRLIS